MISVDEARRLLNDNALLPQARQTPLKNALGQVAAADIRARVSQPPAAVSAMDGYAVAFAGLASHPVLKVVAEARAGAPADTGVRPGQTARVFTGSVIPDGADHVVIQEDVERDGDEIRIVEPQPRARNIRQKGIDFHEGDVLVAAGRVMDPFALAAAASGNHAEISAFRRPRVGVLGTGDELRPPGSTLAPGQIISSTPYAIAPLIEAWGGEAVDLGIAKDDLADIQAKIDRDDIDVFVPLGGASVGDYDKMRPAFAARGFTPVFEKIAVRPGKPTWFSTKGDQRVLGLPGNPASALICAHLFLQPFIRQAAGADPNAAFAWAHLPLAEDLPAAGSRESYVRARRVVDAEGRSTARPLANQDSSILTNFLETTLLIRRPANAEAADASDTVECLEFGVGEKAW